MASDVVSKCPAIFIEPTRSFVASDTEEGMDGECQEMRSTSISPLHITSTPLLTADDVVRRQKRSVDDIDQTSDYGSDPVRVSIISSDNPEETITQSFIPVFEMVKDFSSRRIPHSQSSSSSRKQSQDSLSVSSNCSDDVLVGEELESESDSEVDDNSEAASKGSGSNFSTLRRSSESPEEIAQLLMIWAKDDFIPAAHSVLDVCAEDRPVVLCLQSHLRQLSNTITALCNRLLRKQASTATVEDLTRSIEIAIQKPNSQLSFVVRVLSPTSNSLGPIISKLSRGFSEAVYQDVVTVLQKLAWKIEACVRYESPNSEFECHKAVFDDSHKGDITRFLSVTPPIEPRLRTGSNVRHSTCDCQPNLVEEAVVTATKGSSPKKSAGRVISLDPYAMQQKNKSTTSPTEPSTEDPLGNEQCDMQEKNTSDSEVVCKVDDWKEEDEYFRPLSMRRCQTVTLTVDELAGLGIRQKRNPEKQLEESESDFQAFRSYSQSFFRRPQHLSKVPKTIKQRLNKSIKRKGSFGSLMQVRNMPEYSRDLYQESPSSQPLASELHVPTKPHLPLMKTASYESLTSEKRERSGSPQQLTSAVNESPTHTPKSSSSGWVMPGRFKRWSSSDKRMISTAETVKLPRERTPSKSLFSIFGRRHSQHFLVDDNNTQLPSSPSKDVVSQEGVPPVGMSTPSSAPPTLSVTPPANTAFESPLLKDNTKEEYMQIVVSLVNKKVKKSGSLSRDDPNAWFEIAVTTNLKEYPFEETFKVFRRLAHAQALVKKLNGVLQKSIVLATPGKKLSTKKQRVKLETFLKEVSSNKVLRTHPAVVEFLSPDGAGPQQSGESGQVQSDWELLTTFYCPDKPDNVPGTIHGAIVYDSLTVPEASSSPHNTLKKSYRRSLSLRRKALQVTTVEVLDMQTRVIREDGEDVLIYQVDGQENRVIAGNFDKLAKQLAGEEKPDSYYVTTFLYGLRHFTRPVDVASKLIRRFQMQVPPNATEDERSYAAKWREIIQQRILDVLFQWMQKCWPDFERNEPLVEMMKEFLEPLMEHDNMNFQVQASTMLTLIDSHMSARRTQPSPTNLEPNADDTPPTSPSFFDKLTDIHVPWRELMEISSTQLAKQLTLVELKFLQAIDHFELAMHIWEKKSPDNLRFRRNLDAYIKRFNEVSFWVGTVMCAIPDTKDRSTMIEKFISVAKHCYEYKNFNTMTALLSGLSYSAVNSRRLKRSWMGVREKSMSVFRRLEDLMDPANNLSRYRNVLARVGKREPCIPFFAVYLKDFTFLNDGHARLLSNGLVNFSKLRTLVMKIEEFRRFQESHYYFQRDEHVYMLCLNLYCLSESQLYEASLKIEPNKCDVPVRKLSSGGTVD